MSRRTNDKNLQILKALLKEPGNGHCADCKTASHPRWASWNLGIFICIRCSGIHRSMGTHISRVKSIDLDTWTDEQVASMVKWGNNRANVFWEAKLPGGTHIPDGSKVENFIRTKYDMKKWAASPQVPDPSTIAVGGGSSSASTTSTTSTTSHTPTQPNNSENRRSLNNSLLDLEFGSPIAAPQASSRPANVSSLSTHSLPQSTRTSASASPAIPSNPLPQPPQQHQHQHNSSHQTQRDNSRPELKKSILSLYSTPMASTSTPNFPSRPTQQQTPIYNNSQSSSLAGLNFGSSFTPSPTVAQQQPQQNNWGMNSSNVWASSSTTPQPTQVKSTSLDDDLFKNVWN